MGGSLKYLFLSGHDKSITGGNKRFERLASYGIKNKDCFWVTIERDDLPVNTGRLVYLSKPNVPTYSLRLLYACIRDRKKIKALSAFDKLVVFGETPLLAAIFLAWYLNLELSIGVRSNVPKRHLVELHGKAGLSRLKAKLRYMLNDAVIRFAFRRSIKIIVQSPAARSELCDYYSLPLEKVSFIPNDLPTVPPEIRRELYRRKLKEKPFNILFVGNASRIKGFDNLIEMLHMLNGSGHKCYFKIVGVSKSEVPIFNNVEIIPRSDNIFQLMLDSDLLVVPSREDQFPNVVLEAMAIGLPVIGSDVDGIAYMINDKRFLFEPGASRAFYEVFISLQDKQNYLDLIFHIRERRCFFKFDWEEKYFSIC